MVDAAPEAASELLSDAEISNHLFKSRVLSNLDITHLLSEQKEIINEHKLIIDQATSEEIVEVPSLDNPSGPPQTFNRTVTRSEFTN